MLPGKVFDHESPKAVSVEAIYSHPLCVTPLSLKSTRKVNAEADSMLLKRIAERFRNRELKFIGKKM